MDTQHDDWARSAVADLIRTLAMQLRADARCRAAAARRLKRRTT